MPNINSNLFDVIYELKKQIKLLEELIRDKDSFDPEFFKRAFIRIYCNFAEACNLLREENDAVLVKNFQQNVDGDQLPTKFAWFRNQFLHQYFMII